MQLPCSAARFGIQTVEAAAAKLDARAARFGLPTKANAAELDTGAPISVTQGELDSTFRSYAASPAISEL